MNLENNVVKNTTKLIVHSDGGSRGNPGPSACGYVVEDENGVVLSEGGEYLGITTNNQAEYQGVRMALEQALTLGGQEVTLRADSQLVVNQLKGIYKVKNKDLWPIYDRIKELIAEFKSVHFEHVYREFNSAADAIVNKILDQQEDSV
jgi:ribonuclease HI